MIKKNWTAVDGIKSEKEGFKGMTQYFVWSKDDGCQRFAMRVMKFEPDGHTSYHQHLEEHEFFLVEGEMAIIDGEGKETRLSAGDTAYVPPDEPHQVRNVGNRPMRLLCCIPILPGGDGKAPAPRPEGGDYVTLQKPNPNKP